MALRGLWSVLYYGVLASVTGGWLPYRIKNVWLIVFHLYLFISFIVFPLAIAFIDATHPAGWTVYAVFILSTFLILKVINMRLHKSLGKDPEPEEEEQEEEREGAEGEEGEETEKSDKDKELAAKEKAKMEEAGIVDKSSQDSTAEDERFQRHLDSASTLNHGSSSGAMSTTQSYELQPTEVVEGGPSSTSLPVAVLERTATIEEGNSQQSSTSSSSRSQDRLQVAGEPIAIGLMSPVHRSSSNMDTTALGLIEDGEGAKSLDQERERREDTDTSGDVERSSSMPPPPGGQDDQRRSRVQAGVCIQRQQNIRRHTHDPALHDSYPTRRNAIRGGRGAHKAMSLDEGTRPRSASVSGGEVGRVEEIGATAAEGPSSFSSYSAAGGATASGGASSTAVLSQQPIKEEDPVIEKVKIKLCEDDHLALAEVADRMPSGLHEAILHNTLEEQCISTLTARVNELRRGRLATGDADSAPGTIHWFEARTGDWDFYIFEDRGAPPILSTNEEEPTSDSPTLRAHDDLDIYLHQEILLRYGIDIDELGLGISHPPSRSPPLRRPPLMELPEGPENEREEEAKPEYQILPFVQKTRVPINFARRTLEEFMDRNVTWTEVLMTVALAVGVCIIAALLLSLVDFYHGFWIFWFCFVVGTAHFSLIKSVQDDPASPSPGQNHITALSRAFYLIFVGLIAFFINLALVRIGEDFPPLCVYGFNINSRSVLIFVKDGLLIFILFFPVLFAFGWLPQPDTFVIYLCEQIDMNVFGGTAMTGLVCSLYSIARSVAAALLLLPLGYAAFYTLQEEITLNCLTESVSPNDPRGNCDVSERVALSFYLGALFAMAFLLSRSTSNHQYIWDLLGRLWRKCKSCETKKSPPRVTAGVDFTDPLEEIYSQTLRRRLLSDLIAAVFILFLVSALTISTAFCRHPIPAYVVYGLTCVLGAFNHYIIPHIRKEMPWLIFSEPIVKPKEWDAYEVSEMPKVSYVEHVLQWLLFTEKYILYPLTFLFAFNLSAHHYKARFTDIGAAIVVTVAGLKIIRVAWTELSRQYLILTFTLFFFSFDYRHLSEGLPLDYFIIAILFFKFYDLLLKMYFIFIYIAPWQTSWSSAGHIIIQPLLIPHTPVIFLQTLIGAIMGAPINPVYASTMFFLSYARPVKYWEKNYNTKRSDTSNTRLDSQLEGNLRNPNPDRLDSLFYEHLTWVLQKDLCGDLVLGRWGKVTSGDFFILTSDRLNALVHIIEFGNGFVTFQLRGLEFRGTYCHQREVEAITESIADDEGCCCNEPGHLPYALSCNKAFSSRWLAWEVVSSCYTLHGYSISENQAHLVFNSFDYRKNYITYYVKCIIYKLIKYPHLKELLENEQVQTALNALCQPDYYDPDVLFDEARNCDYSHASGGIVKQQFIHHFHPFIRVCVEQQHLDVDCDQDSFLVVLCFAYSLLGRRMFFQHAQHGAGRRGNDNFMNGLYRMFLGDARPNALNDEWVFNDVDSIQEILIPAARIALKVHQDNFTFSEEYESPIGVYEAVRDVEDNHVVTHENDRAWRTAVVMNKPSLLALRYQRTEDSYIYPYKLIRLTSKFIKFRVVKVNRECVRSLWTSQQQELIFLRNSDSERGSIQNHKQTLRNMINSSMDLPIGYPIYVSPLQTSFIDRHDTYNTTPLGKATNPLSVISAARTMRGWCDSCIERIRGSRSRARSKGEVPPIPTGGESPGDLGEGQAQRRGSIDSLTGIQYDKDYVDPFPESDSESDEQLWKPMWVSKTVVIIDAGEIFENFNVNWLKWQDVSIAQKAMKSHWKAWTPSVGMEGEVVHEWRPFHKDAVQRSHIDKVILLVKMTEDLYVLIKEQGVKEV